MFVNDAVAKDDSAQEDDGGYNTNAVMVMMAMVTEIDGNRDRNRWWW